MTTEPERLEQARTELETATETAMKDDVRDPLRETADAFEAIVTGEAEADYAVLDQHLNTLRRAEDRADRDTAEHVEQALEHAEAYRQDLEQA